MIRADIENMQFLGTFDVVKNSASSYYGLFIGNPTENVLLNSRRDGGGVVSGTYGVGAFFDNNDRVDSIFTWLMVAFDNSQIGYIGTNPSDFDWEPEGRKGITSGMFGIFDRQFAERDTEQERKAEILNQIHLANSNTDISDSLASILFSVAQTIREDLYITPIGVIFTNVPDCEVRVYSGSKEYKYCGRALQFNYFNDQVAF